MKYKSNLLLPIATLFAFCVVAVVPVAAQRGADDGGQNSNSGSSNETETQQSTSTSPAPPTDTQRNRDGGSTTRQSGERETETEHGTEVETEHRAGDDSGKQRDFHSQGLAEIAKLRQENKTTKTAEQRAKVCENRKQHIDDRFDGIISRSQKIQQHITAIQGKAVAYKQASNIEVANWTELLAAADSAKATAQTSVQSLASSKPVLNCGNGNVAEQVATFKAATKQTRQDLKTYRSAVKAVLNSLSTVKSDDNSEAQQ